MASVKPSWCRRLDVSFPPNQLGTRVMEKGTKVSAQDQLSNYFQSLAAKMNESFPDLTPQACKLWDRVPAHIRPELLANVFCGDCRGETTIVNFQGKLKQGMLVLEGSCQRCFSSMARVID